MAKQYRQQGLKNRNIFLFIAPYLELIAYLILCFQIVTTALYYNGFMNPLIHKMLLGQILALAAWLLFAFYSLSIQKVIIRHSPYYLPLLVLCIWAGFRAYTAPNDDAVRNYWIFINLVCTFPLWVTGFRYRYVRSLFLWTVVFCGVAMALGCIRQLMVSDPRLDWSWFPAITLSPGSYDRQRLGSFMGHNNDSTDYMAIAAIYAGLLWIRYRRTWNSVFFGVYILMAAVFIYLGGSRGVTLMILAALALLSTAWLIHARRKGYAIRMPHWTFPRQKKVYGGVLLATVIFLFLFLSQVPLEQKEIKGVWARFLSPPEHLVSGTYPRVWWMSLLMARDNPFMGVGFSAWPFRYPDYQKEWFTSHPDTILGLPILGVHSLQGHNDYLQLWAELGLIGLFCMFWLLWVHSRSLIQILKAPRISPLALFALAATVATLARAIFAFPFHMTAASCLFIANVALVSSRICDKEWEWKPKEETGISKQSRWGIGIGIVLVFCILSYSLWVMIVADYSAMLHFRKAKDAQYFLDRGDQENYRTCVEEGYKAIQYSLRWIPNQGKYRYEFGEETVRRGLYANDEQILLQGVEHLKRAQQGYGFYRTHENLGLAYRKLWELTQKPEYLDESLKEYREAVAIMPVFMGGWVQQAFLLAKSGKDKECLDLLANTELRFPGFIVRDVLKQAKIESDIKNKVLLYDLAASIKPMDETIFRETLLLYLGLERMDRAVQVYLLMAQYQTKEVAINWLTTILLTQLEHRMYQEALDMMRILRNQPVLNTTKEIWYYSGIISWMTGHADDTIYCWTMARNLGVPLEQLDPPLSTILHHLLLPLNAW